MRINARFSKPLKTVTMAAYRWADSQLPVSIYDNIPAPH
jgi:hypothetical protein